MKKTTLPKLLFLFTFLFLSPSLFAVTITWTGAGANNLWSNTANWDIGIVPTSADDVILPAGAGVVRFNYSNRKAKSIAISAGTTLRIINGAKLRLISAGTTIGVNNDGTLDVRGTLVIENTTSIGIKNNGTLSNKGLISIKNISLYGILSEGAIFNRSTGILKILNGGSAEDIMTVNGTFRNEGTLRLLAGGTGNGVALGDGFINTTTGSIFFEDAYAGRLHLSGISSNLGLIEIINPATNGYPMYLSAGSTFVNESSGEVIMEGCENVAGLVVTSNATLENKGLIRLSDFGTYTYGISMVAGRMSNSATGIIETNVTYIGIYVNGEFENDGDISIIASHHALSISGEATNYSGGSIDMIIVDEGINIDYGGSFTNDDGFLLFSSVADYDIHNAGTFLNLDCGFVKGNNKIKNAGGVFENEAWLSYRSDGDDHVYLATKIENTGVIIDPFDRFANALNNQEARVIPLVSPQANVDYPNALDIANVTTSSIGDFYLDALLTMPAGSYDHATNIYTPNNAAIGATSLYTAIDQNCFKIVEIPVNGGVLPIVNDRPKEQLISQQGSTKDIESKNLTVFPNPTTGNFQAQLPALESTSYDLQILNAQGQIMTSQKGDSRHEKVATFDLREYPAGMYWVRLLADGELITQEKIIRLR